VSGLSESGGDSGGDSGAAEASGTSAAEGTAINAGGTSVAIQGASASAISTDDGSAIVRLLDGNSVDAVVGIMAVSETEEEEAVAEVRRNRAEARRAADDVFASLRGRSRRSASLEELLADLGGLS
jgi:hypothetical protein